MTAPALSPSVEEFQAIIAHTPVIKVYEPDVRMIQTRNAIASINLRQALIDSGVVKMNADEQLTSRNLGTEHEYKGGINDPDLSSKAHQEYTIEDNDDGTKSLGRTREANGKLFP